MRRLKASKGAKGNTLTMFAEKYLVKKAYFELCNETMMEVALKPAEEIEEDDIQGLLLLGFPKAKTSRT